MIEGYYYLHENGELIFKRNYDGVVADIRESDFCRHLWPMDTTKRLHAWNLLVEGLSLGANKNRVDELAIKWKCDNKDAEIYASYIGCVIKMDGSQFCATRKDFTNLQESPVGFGTSALEAMAELCTNLGFKAGKLWQQNFEDLLK